MKLNITPDRFAGAVGLIGVGATTLVPKNDAVPVAWLFVLLVISVLACGIEFRDGQFATAPIKTLGLRIKTMWAQALMIGGALAFVIGLIAYLRVPAPQRGVQGEGRGYVTPPPVSVAKKLSLLEAQPHPVVTVVPKIERPRSIRLKVPRHLRSVAQITTENGEGLVTGGVQSASIEKTFVEPTVYSGISDEQLRARVEKIGNGLRELEQRYHVAQLTVSNAPLAETSESGQRLEIAQRRSRLTQLHEDEQLEFRKQYLSDARDIRSEMAIRAAQKKSGTTEPPGSWADAFTALNSGFITNRTPLAELADYLDAYSKEI